MTRRFLLLVHRVPVDGEFTLNDLAGAGGRMDEVASVIGATFLISNAIRRDTELTLLLCREPDRARRVRLVGDRLRYLNPDERSTAALIKNALVRSWTRPNDEMETTPGVFVGPARCEADLREFLALPGVIWATEGGELAIPDPVGSSGDRGVVLSDPWDPGAGERALLEASGIPRRSLGPRSLRSSSCVTIFHNLWDRGNPPSPPGAGSG